MVPAVDTLRAMTINGSKVSATEMTRGPITGGFIADLIADPGTPPAAFFHAAPVDGWRIR